MTLSIVDPLGDYNTANATSWVANDAGAKCIYLPGAGEFWLLLETGTGPTASGSNSTNSRFLRIDEATGNYIDMADDPTGQAGKLFLWGPIVADDVNSLVIAGGSYVTTSGGTTIGGQCLIAWNFDGTVAWETFWVTESDGSPFTFNHILHIIYNPTLGALYVHQNGLLNDRLQSLNLSTGARTSKATFRPIAGDYRPAMDNAGDVWINVDPVGGLTQERRYTLTGTPSFTTIQTAATGQVMQRQAYDEVNDISHWYVSSAAELRYWDGAAVQSVSAGSVWSSSGGTGSTSYEQFASRTGYWAYTVTPSTARDAYFSDLGDLSVIKQVTEPADTYSTEYGAGELKWQFSTSINRAWWRIKQTTWKFLVWTDVSARRRVSVCVIT